MQFCVYLLLAPLLVTGFIAGLAWVGLAAGFRLGGMWITAVEDKAAWRVHIKSTTGNDGAGHGGAE